MDNMQKKIKQQQEDDSKKLMDLMRVDSDKILDMELKVRRITGIESKISSINNSITQFMQTIDETRENSTFLERTLPFLIHL